MTKTIMKLFGPWLLLAALILILNATYPTLRATAVNGTTIETTAP